MAEDLIPKEVLHVATTLEAHVAAQTAGIGVPQEAALLWKRAAGLLRDQAATIATLTEENLQLRDEKRSAEEALFRTRGQQHAEKR